MRSQIKRTEQSGAERELSVHGAHGVYESKRRAAPRARQFFMRRGRELCSISGRARIALRYAR